MTKYDVFIPYADASTEHSDLFLCLETLKKFALGLRCVWIVTNCPNLPLWIADIANVVCGGDTYSSCKDANLIRKTIIAIDAGCGRAAIGEDVPIVWMSDDNAIIKPMNLAEQPRVYNVRSADEFKSPKANKWQKRMARTFDKLRVLGKAQKYNFDAHCPQTFERKQLLDACLNAPNDRDVCIHTWCCGYIWGSDAHKSAVEQDSVKIRFEGNKNIGIDASKYSYVGWNDSGRADAHALVKGALENVQVS